MKARSSIGIIVLNRAGWLLAGAGSLSPIVGLGQEPPQISSPAAHASQQMLLNFHETDLQAVVKAMSQITGYNFLLDPKAQGKITIISSKPVSRGDAYQIFLAALQSAGFAAVRSPGGVIRIVREGEAKQRARVVEGRGPGEGHRWITQIVPVEHAAASQIAALLKPLLEPEAQVSVYAPANTLILTATASNIRSLLRVIEDLDRRDDGQVAVIPIRNASALDVAQLLGKLSEGRDSTERRFTAVADARSNSILARAPNPAQLESLRSLIAKLDVPANSTQQARVVYLRNAEAKRMAEILRGLINGKASGSAGAPTAEEALVQFDESSNALVISAPETTYNNLRGVIERLDTARAQVFVEALIAEVTINKAAQFGIQWGAAKKVGKGAFGAVGNASAAGPSAMAVAANPAAAFAAAPDGLTIGYLSNNVTLPDGSRVAGLAALARALERDSSVNILSTPDLLTLDNSEARIMIGQNVPFLTGRFAQAVAGAGGVNPFQTIERKDVGLTLKIKPQISEGGQIKLQIFQEVSSIVPTSLAQAQDLITNKRSLEATVTVEDGHIVVLGGLIQDTVTENVDAVPLLSRIPLLGELFKFRDRRKEKINLMVFLRPQVVRSSQEAWRIGIDRYEFIRAQEGAVRLKPSPVLETYSTPLLPKISSSTEVVPLTIESNGR